MIILSGVLVVLAIALLVTGIVTGNTGHEVAGLDGLKLIYVSIGISIISALCLAIGVFLRRKELFGSAEAESSAKRSAARSKTARTAKAKARVGAGEEAPVSVVPTTAIDVPPETSVYVIPGRKRYHLETCRQLAGRDKEELTYVEAREEGFTACTACLPDTALAARAAVTETEPAAETPASPEDARPTESLETAADTAELTAPRADDPASVTRTDLPVTRLDDDETAPAAESPAAAESTVTSEADTLHEADHHTDQETDAEPQSEVAEEPSEPAAERPLARSRSFFEPLDRDDASTSDETPAEDDDAARAEEPAEPEAATPAPSEPEAAEEPEAVEDSETAEQPSETEDEPAAEAPAETDSAETDSAETAVTETGRSDDADDRAADEAEDRPDDQADEEPADTDESATGDEDEDEDETPKPADDAESDASADDASDDDASEDDAASDDSLVRILSGTKRYHRPNCALIEDIADDADDLESLTRTEAKERGCTPCLVCQPDKDPSDDSY
ncbi:hypothetical protein [Actinoallomurus sp. CA-142502]|uniref:hypothetical protein n=1 Tax=Actinoallomurus sp. CA-142502 TaxID=3239885 RepID=UPI003D9426D8